VHRTADDPAIVDAVKIAHQVTHLREDKVHSRHFKVGPDMIAIVGSRRVRAIRFAVAKRETHVLQTQCMAEFMSAVLIVRSI
jgi:hypothetical protein